MDDDEEDNGDTPDTVVRLIPMEMDLTGQDNIASTLDEEEEEEEEEEEDEESISSEEKEIKETCPAKTARYAKMILPHIGLVLLLGVYTVCGAGIFHIVELPHEVDLFCVLTFTNAYYLESKQKKFRHGDYDEVDWKIMAAKQIKSLERVLYQAYKDDYVNLDDILTNFNGTSRRQMWTVPQAIFFSTTVITTIGVQIIYSIYKMNQLFRYGNLVPQTTSGRIFCIVFGLFGIPLLLITIADIGKFLSDLMKYFYRTYRSCMRRLEETRRKFSEYRHGRRPGESSSRKSMAPVKDEMRLPWIMVLLVLVTYTAAGALLFHLCEGWDYFASFYFCFITMATVGFGDIVPTQQVYMFFTIAYILIGLALTTMCIDLAGTEYIAKIHYFGQEIDAAKGVVGGAVVSGLHAGENLFKHTGYDFIKTAGGRFVQVRRSFNVEDMPEGMTEREYLALRRRGLAALHHNILFSPVSPEVERLLKPHIKIRLEDLKETDAYIVENKTFNKPLDRPRKPRKHARKTIEEMRYKLRSQSWPRKPGSAPEDILIVAPFLLKESDV